VAKKVASGSKGLVVLKSKDVNSYLGPRKFHFDMAERTLVPGVAMGLAWTPAGGDVLFVEATGVDGNSGLLLTGQLGDVMKESAMAALTYIRSHTKELGLNAKDLKETGFHVHVPAGAIPKDGPSAGVTMFTALLSNLTGRPVRPDVAMTGEITLRGAVLPVGGIKEKVLAAGRAGVRRVVLPAENEKDLIDVPKKVQKGLKFHFVKRMEELSPLVLRPKSGNKKAGTASKRSKPSGNSGKSKAKPASKSTKRRGAAVKA
jgi:ATP-dependent Lon protease